MNRRSVLQVAAAGAAWAGISRAPAAGDERHTIKAIAFDGFTVFDPRPAAARAEALYPAVGGALVAAWRTRQFEYQWLRTLAGRHADFVQTAESALVFAARTSRLELTAANRAELMHALLDLKPWPDAADAVRQLKADGLRLVFCSNMTARMLDDGIRNAGLAGFFEDALSADRVRAHKPHPRAYAMAIRALGLRREEVMFAAFAGWDVAGARWFGYPTYWVNRSGAMREELDAEPESMGTGLEDLTRYLRTRNA